MFKQFITTIFVSLFCLCLSAKTAATASWQIIPLPKQVTTTGGQPFMLSGKTTIYYADGDAKQKRNAEFLASYIKEITGINVATTTRKAQHTLACSMACRPS